MSGRRGKLKKTIIYITIIFVILLILIVFINPKNKMNEKHIREPQFSGTWYPGDKVELEKSIKEYFEGYEKKDFNGKVKAVIVPHASYVYSGKIAASAFNQLEENYKTVFLMGPSHYYFLKNVSISSFKYYSTPLGNIKVSKKAKEIVNNEKTIFNIEEAHEKEHSLEIELPFLQSKLKEFEIVPMLVGETNSVELKEVILKYLEEDDLIVVSVDLSHYHEYNQAIDLDSYSIGRIMDLDSKGIFSAEIDAPWAVASLLEIAKEKSWKPYFISYANSGDISGDNTSVVGYSAIVFVDESEFNYKEKEFMLNLARKNTEEYLKSGKSVKIDEKNIPEKLKEKRGCFVTFSKNNELRGCIGHIIPQKSLYECIIENSINAAVNDERFFPLTKKELEEAVIDISVLDIPTLFEYENYEELLKKLDERKYGIVLIRGEHQSTFLPSVWEFIPNKENFLGNLCIKGGMEAECWKDSETKVFLYKAEDFSG